MSVVDSLFSPITIFSPVEFFLFRHIRLVQTHLDYFFVDLVCSMNLCRIKFYLNLNKLEKLNYFCSLEQCVLPAMVQQLRDWEDIFPFGDWYKIRLIL